MIKAKVRYFIGVIGFICLLCIGRPVGAESDVDFSVETIPSDFQVNAEVTYFDLRMVPKQQTDLKVRIYNHASRDQRYLVSLRNATTNANGLIVYEEKNPLQLALSSLSELTRAPKNPIQIKAGQSKVVSLKLTMPEQAIEGTLLAGIEIKKQEEQEKSSEQVGIQSRQAYVIGVKVRSSVRDVEPDITFEGVKADVHLYRPSVLVTLANRAPAISKKILVEMTVKKNKKLIIRKKMNAQFAPTTYMTVPLASTGILTPGTYQLDVKMTGDKEKWSFKDDFTISENQVKKMKKTVPDVEQHPNSFLGENSKALMIGSFLIIILLLGYIYRLKRKVSSK